MLGSDLAVCCSVPRATHTDPSSKKQRTTEPELLDQMP